MQPHPRTPRPRLPTFRPVPVRPRADGWTPVRQAEFIGKLAETGSVAAAAAFVGMRRETAYRLRGKPGAAEFVHAWDVALQIAGVRHPGEPGVLPPVRYGGPEEVAAKVTPPDLWRRIVDGRWRPVLRRGKYVGSVRKADDSALLSSIAQTERSFRAMRKQLCAEVRSQARKVDSVSRSQCKPRPEPSRR